MVESVFELFEEAWLHPNHQITEKDWHELSLEARSVFFAMKVLGWKEGFHTDECSGSEPGARFNGDGYDITFAYLHPPHLRDDVDSEHPDSLEEWLESDYDRLYNLPEFASDFNLAMPLLEQFRHLEPALWRGASEYKQVFLWSQDRSHDENEAKIPWEWTVRIKANKANSAYLYAGCCDFQYVPSAICAALLKAHGFMTPEYHSP